MSKNIDKEFAAMSRIATGALNAGQEAADAAAFAFDYGRRKWSVGFDMAEAWRIGWLAGRRSTIQGA
jgi:hypothetical protein